MAENLPTIGRLVSSTVKSVFKDRMDELLVDLGRKITLNLKPTKEDCPNCLWDSQRRRSKNIYDVSNPNSAGPLHKQFLDGQTCPVCNGAGVLMTPRTAEYTATISKTFKPNELVSAGIGQTTSTTIKTNTVIDSYKDVTECESALIDGNLYTLQGRPVKTGLQDLIRVKAFWEAKS